MQHYPQPEVNEYEIANVVCDTTIDEDERIFNVPLYLMFQLYMHCLVLKNLIV